MESKKIDEKLAKMRGSVENNVDSNEKRKVAEALNEIEDLEFLYSKPEPIPETIQKMMKMWLVVVVKFFFPPDRVSELHLHTAGTVIPSVVLIWKLF